MASPLFVGLLDRPHEAETVRAESMTECGPQRLIEAVGVLDVEFGTLDVRRHRVRMQG